MTEQDPVALATAIYEKSKAAAKATEKLRSVVSLLDKHVGSALEQFYPGDIFAQPFGRPDLRLCIGKWTNSFGIWVEKREGTGWALKSKLALASLEELGSAIDALPKMLASYNEKLGNHIARTEKQVVQAEKLVAALLAADRVV